MIDYILIAVTGAPQLPNIESGEFSTWAATLLLITVIGLFSMLVKNLANQQKKDREKINELDLYQKTTLTQLVTESTITLNSNNSLMKEMLKLLAKMS